MNLKSILTQMCFHRQQRETLDDLANYYSAAYEKVMAEIYGPMFYENGFDFRPGPVITAQRSKEIQLYSWGLIPWWIKNPTDAKQIRLKTLNCISEEMFDKPSFRDAIKEGRRCLVPCTGFFEWRHVNGGKQKYPYFVFLKDQPLFSLAGLYSTWVDKTTGEEFLTYTVLTTKANELMEKVHNSKKRMPVIIPREYERDWLREDLTKEDVLAFCQSLDAGRMDAYTISKRITDRNLSDKNIPEINKHLEYPELALLDA
jgi:putative SOS response-associated peptidase YedK